MGPHPNDSFAQKSIPENVITGSNFHCVGL